MNIIKISALWCPGCLAINNICKKICEEYNFELLELDYDFDEEKVKKYNVGNILPVLVFERNNKEVLRIIGEKTYEYIKEQINYITEEK